MLSYIHHTAKNSQRTPIDGIVVDSYLLQVCMTLHIVCIVKWGVGAHAIILWRGDVIAINMNAARIQKPMKACQTWSSDGQANVFKLWYQTCIMRRTKIEAAQAAIRRLTNIPSWLFGCYYIIEIRHGDVVVQKVGPSNCDEHYFSGPIPFYYAIIAIRWQMTKEGQSEKW